MQIHPTAIIEDGARLAEDVIVGAYSRVGPKATLAAGVVLSSHVVVEGRTTVGKKSAFWPFAVVGAPPQHLGYRGEDTSLTIGENCIIREHATVHIGAPAGRGHTSIGDRCFLMVGSHVAHDCVVGHDVILANGAMIGGHVSVGDFAFLGGLSAVHQFCRIGAYAFVGGCATVVSDIIPHASAVGNRAALGGLNVIGMKRRGFDRKTIQEVRSAFRELFAREGLFAVRVDAVAKRYAANVEVMRIIAFIREDKKRPLMGLRRQSWSEEVPSE